jgi:DNA-binding MarR family transcriptional regulator
MEQQWMGRYREFVAQLVRHSNVCARILHKTQEVCPDIQLSAQQWQTLEYIIEYEDDMLNMSKYAERLGMPQSSFSKCIKKLVDIGLIDKYKTNQNKKEIIVRASKKGREVYTLHSKNLNHNIFNKMFEILSPLNDQDMKLVADAIKALNDSLYSTVKVESSDTLIKVE